MFNREVFLLPSFWENLKAQFTLNFINDNRWRYIWIGLGNTIKIAFMALILGVVLGSVIAIIRASWDKNGNEMRKGPAKALLGVLNWICKLYLTVIRGTPVIV